MTWGKYSKKKGKLPVIEISQNAFTINTSNMRNCITYGSFDFYGLNLIVQYSTLLKTVTVFLGDKYPEGMELEKIRDIPESQHITQNGCNCPKCKKLTLSYKKTIKDYNKKVKKNRVKFDFT